LSANDRVFQAKKNGGSDDVFGNAQLQVANQQQDAADPALILINLIEAGLGSQHVRCGPKGILQAGKILSRVYTLTADKTRSS
jgi:hypothetical protein